MPATVALLLCVTVRMNFTTRMRPERAQYEGLELHARAVIAAKAPVVRSWCDSKEPHTQWKARWRSFGGGPWGASTLSVDGVGRAALEEDGRAEATRAIHNEGGERHRRGRLCQTSSRW